MKQFDDESIKRIARTVREYEARERGAIPQKRFTYLGGSGGGGSAIFKVDDTLPARSGSTLGRVRLTRMELDEGEMVEGDKDYVYNLSASAIVKYQEEEEEEEEEETEASCTIELDGFQYLIANKVSGLWTTTISSVFEIADVTVATGLSFSDDAMKLERSILRVVSVGDCEPTDVIEIENCDEEA